MVGTDPRRESEGRMGLVRAQFGAMGKFRLAILWRHTGGAGCWLDAGRIPRKAGNPGACDCADRLSAARTRNSAAAQSPDAVMGLDETSRRHGRAGTAVVGGRGSEEAAIGW